MNEGSRKIVQLPSTANSGIKTAITIVFIIIIYLYNQKLYLSHQKFDEINIIKSHSYLIKRVTR